MQSISENAQICICINLQSSGQIQCNAAQNGNSVKCWESAGGPHCSVKHNAENWLNVEEM